MNVMAIAGGVALVLLQILTEYVKASPERKAKRDALVQRDIHVLDAALDPQRRMRNQAL